MMRISIAGVVLFVAFAVAGCGGGGGSDSSQVERVALPSGISDLGAVDLETDFLWDWDRRYVTQDIRRMYYSLEPDRFPGSYCLNRHRVRGVNLATLQEEIVLEFDLDATGCNSFRINPYAIYNDHFFFLSLESELVVSAISARTGVFNPNDAAVARIPLSQSADTKTFMQVWDSHLFIFGSLGVTVIDISELSTPRVIQELTHTSELQPTWQAGGMRGGLLESGIMYVVYRDAVAWYSVNGDGRLREAGQLPGRYVAQSDGMHVFVQERTGVLKSDGPITVLDLDKTGASTVNTIFAQGAWTVGDGLVYLSGTLLDHPYNTRERWDEYWKFGAPKIMIIDPLKEGPESVVGFIINADLYGYQTSRPFVVLLYTRGQLVASIGWNRAQVFGIAEELRKTANSPKWPGAPGGSPAFGHLKDPNPEFLIPDIDGSLVSVAEVIVVMEEEFSEPGFAEAVAQSESATIVGADTEWGQFQFFLPTRTLPELDSVLGRLAAHEYVKIAAPVAQLKESGWDAEPDYWPYAGRPFNRVNEGTDTFNQWASLETGRREVVQVGIIELTPKVDFNLNDFAVYAGGVQSNGIRLTADPLGSVSDCENNSHATRVVGAMVAQVGNGGMGGLLAALDNSLGGFEIMLSGSVWNHRASHQARKLLEENGAMRVLNLSYGAEGGILGTNFAFGLHQYTNYMHEKLFEQFPHVLFVVASHNQHLNLDHPGVRVSPAQIAQRHANVILVGGHAEDRYEFCNSNGTCDKSGNFGSFVDIAAMYYWGTFLHCRKGADGKTHIINYTQGTSFSAPLVAATAAAMLSVNPALTPVNIASILRQTALPLPVEVRPGGGAHTRPLSFEEVDGDPERIGKSARLNVEGSILAAIDSLGTEPSWPRHEKVVDGATILLLNRDGHEYYAFDVDGLNGTVPRGFTNFTYAEWEGSCSGTYRPNVNFTTDRGDYFSTSCVGQEMGQVTATLVNQPSESGSSMEIGLSGLAFPRAGAEQTYLNLDIVLRGTVIVAP